jgi:pimeloyl-ACP methyl ester carboxylesterase
VRVVLLHAFPFDERMWELQLGALGGHDVLTPHLYGLGASMDDWAASVAERVGGSPSNTVLQGDGVAVVGASMGGYCAQRLLAHPDVRALVLVGSRAEADPPERRQARDETIRLIREEGVAALWEKQRPVLFPENAEEGVVARARALALDQAPEELATGVAAMRDRPDSTELVRETGAQLLVLRGEHDPFLGGDEAQALAASARSGRSHTFAGSGHLPSLERPEEFNEVLTEFLGV